MKVLVVVDQPPVLDAISATLRSEGHAVVTACDLSGALRQAAAEHPAAVILGSPLDGSSDDLCRLLRDGTGVPVLLLDRPPGESLPQEGARSAPADTSVQWVSVGELAER